MTMDRLHTTKSHILTSVRRQFSLTFSGCAREPAATSGHWNLFPLLFFNPSVIKDWCCVIQFFELEMYPEASSKGFSRMVSVMR